MLFIQINHRKSGFDPVQAVLTLFYPRRCPVCDRILLPEEPYLCGECFPKTKPIMSMRCKKCGKPLPEREAEYCRDCLNVRHYFSEGFAAYVYSGRIQGSLLRFKQGGRQEYAPFYARSMFISGRDFFSRCRPEVLIPIPADPKRKRKRGYNQSELLALELGKLTGLPVDTRLLLRRKTGHREQKALNHAERRKNLKGIFYLDRDQVPYHRILLVDDIFTTGSTIDAAALLLRAHGAGTVWFCTAAIGRNH